MEDSYFRYVFISRLALHSMTGNVMFVPHTLIFHLVYGGKHNSAAFKMFFVMLCVHTHNYRQRQKGCFKITGKDKNERLVRWNQKMWSQNVARTHRYSQPERTQSTAMILLSLICTHSHILYLHVHTKEMKEVVGCLLPWLITNSVNEAALSPQIEQMNMRYQQSYPPHKHRERTEGTCVRPCLCMLVCEKGVLWTSYSA